MVCLLTALVRTPTAFALDTRKAITQYVHDVWQVNDGLPQNSVLAITQTRDGYLWLGTFEGLARFDGAQFTVFDKGNTENIKNNNIMALIEDQQGTLWIGTYGGGLARLKDGTFTTYTTKDGLSNDLVLSVYADSKGRLWIGTTSGLNQFTDGKFTTYTKREGLSDDHIMSICEDREGALWIGTRGGGLNRFRDGRFTAYTTKEGLPSNYVRYVYEDRKGNLWIGTWGGGLSRMKNGQFTTHTTKEGLSNDLVRCIYQDREGNLWIGTSSGGLNRLMNGQFTSFTTSDGLSDDFVVSIHEDREGSLWVGTNTGLNRFRDGKFTTYTTKEGLPDDDAWCVYEDREGSLWIGTDGGGLIRMKEGRFTNYTTKDGLSNNFVYSVFRDRAGSLWVGTNGGGLNRLREGRFAVYTTKEGLSGNIVLAISEDREGSLWVGTNGGLSRFKDETFTTYTTKEGFGHSVISIQEDRDGSLWFGTEGSGLVRMKDGRITIYTTKEGLSNDIVLSIYQDREGTLWVGTDSGLNRFKDGRFTTYTTKEGLFNDVVFQILEDASGNFWMSCNKGIFRVSRRELEDFAHGRISFIRSVSYGQGDGLRSSECNGSNQPAAWKSRDGRLWFPTIKGVAAVDPEHLKVNPLLPPVIIEQVVVDNKPVAELTKRIKLAPGKERFAFHYTGLSLLAPDKVRFKYKLEGFDKDWLDAGGQRTVYYTHLPPGAYRFRVIACNNDGLWNETGAAAEFYLQPYFYQTGWFYALAALAVILMGFGLYQLRVRQLKARERELVRLVGERTQQLKEANDTLQRLATTDELTGIANHRRFKEFLDDEWRRAVRRGAPLSLIMIDIDFFKTYNDTYGHQAGDACLKQVANVLSETVNRSTDFIARYGGEEFVVVLAEADGESAAMMAERMRACVEALNMPHIRSNASDHVTISAGVATTVPALDSVPAMLIAAADQALYQAKQAGRNRIKSYDSTAVQIS
jgi:diguanylate cyclase (GGDEF)-like protein